jgi:hypothetical protein
MRRTRKQGGNRPLPLQYFGDAAPASASEGSTRLNISGNMVRPAIGGKRIKQRKQSKRKTQKGGFVPSVMGNFVASASKYITPLALFAAYKLMKHPTKRSTRKTRKQSK